MAHVCFQELLSVSESVGESFTHDSRIRLELNPIHHSAVFQTNVLLGDDDFELPATAVFFPVGDDVRTAILDSMGLQIMQQLDDGAASFADLCQALGDNHDVVSAACFDLIDVGLAACR